MSPLKKRGKERIEIPSSRENWEGFLGERFGLGPQCEESLQQGAHKSERVYLMKDRKYEGAEKFGK